MRFLLGTLGVLFLATTASAQSSDSYYTNQSFQRPQPRSQVFYAADGAAVTADGQQGQSQRQRGQKPNPYPQGFPAATNTGSGDKAAADYLWSGQFYIVRPRVAGQRQSDQRYATYAGTIAKPGYLFRGYKNGYPVYELITNGAQ